jgi:hypothetical protein
MKERMLNSNRLVVLKEEKYEKYIPIYDPLAAAPPGVQPGIGYVPD